MTYEDRLERTHFIDAVAQRTFQTLLQARPDHSFAGNAVEAYSAAIALWRARRDARATLDEDIAMLDAEEAAELAAQAKED